MKKMKQVLSILLALLMVVVSVPFVYADESVSAPYWGDLSGDQKANFTDMLKINRFLDGRQELTNEQKCFGDVNLDGVLTGQEDSINSDMYLINRRQLNYIQSFPAESLAKITFNPPTKTAYNVGESLNTAGMSVIVQNKNNSNVKYTLTDNISVTGYNANTTGTQQLTATFRDLTFKFNVTVSRKTHTVTYNYSTNGGTSATQTTATVAEGSPISLSPTATKSGWQFVGWNTNANATTGLTSLNMGTSNVTLYAIFKKTLTGTFIDYSGTTKKTTTKTVDIYNNATSGTLTAPTQNTYTGWTSRGWATGTAADASAVSSFTVSANTTYYGLYQRTLTLSYNANDGSSTPSSQTGTQYANSYGISSTKNPTLKLANAISKSGSTFDGWAMGSASGTKYAAGANVTISAKTTMYATWKVNVNIYNMGEESYRFENYGDADASGGHCFGMSATSSGYYSGKLSKTSFGGQDSTPLYSYADSPEIRKPICHYQGIQGSELVDSLVAGGSRYSAMNLSSDWNSLIAYVKDHNHDGKGDLIIGIDGTYTYYYWQLSGGHAVNFLRYEVVEGQERIYVYDNNFPEEETYFYKDSKGKVYQEPYATFDISNDGLTLFDANTFLEKAKSFNPALALYANEGALNVKGAKEYRMYSTVKSEPRIMYELSKTTSSIEVKPKKDDASVVYLGQEYKFDKIDDDTYGVLKVSTYSGTGAPTVKWEIVNAPTDNPTTPTKPDQPTVNPNACKYCGKEHTGLFGWLTKFFHNILFSIFGAKK